MPIATHERIKYWRERLELSQKELGDRCGMVQYKISRIETNATDVSAGDLEIIVMRGLGLSMAEFYSSRARAS